MIRKYELLRTGATTSNVLTDNALLGGSIGGSGNGMNGPLGNTVDESTMLQIR